MDKRVLLVGLLLALVLLSGCLKINFKEVIDEQGMSTVSVSMDMSQFPSMGDEEQNPCDSMNTSESPMTEVSCTYEDKILTMTGKFDRSNSPGFTIDGDRYRLDVKQAFQAFNAEESSGQSLPEDEAQIGQMKAMGFEMNYIVKLPGTVTEQKGGELQDDGSVKFDLLDMPDDAFVESSTAGFFLNLDTSTILIIVGAVIVVLAVVLVILLKK